MTKKTEIQTTEKELKKLRRVDLLELLFEQSKEIDRLNGIIENLEKQLEDRTIQIEKAGTLADAAIALNGVLEAAQKAADQYLENIKARAEAESDR